MEKIVVLDAKAIPTSFSILKPSFEHEWVSFDQTQYDDIYERAKDATMILTSKCILDANLLSKLDKLKYIGVMATGFNNIDVAYCSQNNIVVTNAQGYSTQSVAEHTICMMLMLARSMQKTHTKIKEKYWSEISNFFFLTDPIINLNGKVLTIVGSGTIGQKLCQIAKAFGMEVLFAEHKKANTVRDGYTKFTDAIRNADFISISCPLNNDTKDLFTEKEFEIMKKSVFIINNARGGIVNESDLTEAIINGDIAGAALDVASKEPLAKDHPFNKIVDRDNFILTPHQAWASNESVSDLIVQLKENMEAFHEGKALRVVS